jgi:hypothetical protein
VTNHLSYGMAMIILNCDRTWTAQDHV